MYAESWVWRYNSSNKNSVFVVATLFLAVNISEHSEVVMVLRVYLHLKRRRLESMFIQCQFFFPILYKENSILVFSIIDQLGDMEHSSP